MLIVHSVRRLALSFFLTLQNEVVFWFCSYVYRTSYQFILGSGSNIVTAKVFYQYCPINNLVLEGLEVFLTQTFRCREVRMTKREIIDRIMEINTSAKPEFLADFSQESLAAYLAHLTEVLAERQEQAFLEPALV